MDELGAAGAQRVGVEPEPRHGAGDQVLHEHVGGVDQPVQQRAIARVLDVELEALLAAIEPDEVRAVTVDGAVVRAREIADTGALDLDHACAEVGQVTGGERRRDRLLEGDDRDVFEWVHVATR